MTCLSTKLAKRCRFAGHLGLLLACLLNASLAFAVNVPDDPSQSIRYWKPQVIQPQKDPNVALAHELFGQLLGAWDISRVEPTLNVVGDSDGPWAASLADGNILLSRSAINNCLSFGKQRGQHLLAFILAHELAHQKGNDLWHQQFFRLIGNQAPEVAAEIKRDLAINADQVAQMESVEAQADLDAVVMMASVGYDPYQIIKDNDFYTAWIENIWNTPCTNEMPACAKAKERALRTQAQLSSISEQSIFYELGLQALVAKRYPQAREYLTAYARNFPGRAVHNSIGVSYLAEAISLWPEYASKTQKPNVYFPIFVEATPSWRNIDNTQKRGSVAQLKSNIKYLSEQALNYFEKAQRLSPEHRETHYLRALSYVLMENGPMARGIIEGQYIPIFGHDIQSDLLQALAFASNKQIAKSEKQLVKSLKKYTALSNNQNPALLFALIQNQTALAEFNDDATRAKKLWKNFAQTMGRQGEGYLLQLSLNKLREASNTPPMRKHVNTQLSYKNIQLDSTLKNSNNASTKIWFDGEPIHIRRDQNGVWLSNKQNKVIALWLNSGNFEGIDRLHMGDHAERVIRVIGPADRQITLSSGEFLAYDQLGLAIRVSQNKIASWFLYEAE
ncbi:MAG: hypothetical protein K6L76_09940 [Agarilytica sp.]